MPEWEKILAFTNCIRHLSSTLKSMGVEIEDEEMAMAVQNELPEQFKQSFSALDALGNEDEIFSLDVVKSGLSKNKSAW